MPEIDVGVNPRKAITGSAAVNKALSSIGKASSGVSSILGKIFNPFTTAIGGLGAYFGAGELISIGDTYTNIAGQLEYLTGSAMEAERAQNLLYQMSQKTGTSFTENAKAISRFQLASEQTGLSIDQNVKVLGAINTLMLKTGTSTAEASSAMLQLGQALASGRLQGDEFRSIAENAPALMNELAKAIGVSRAELKEMGAEGKLTSEILGQAFLQISESGAASAEELPLTVGRMWEKVKNSFQRAWDAINDKTGVLAWIATGLENLATWIENNTDVFVRFFLDMKDRAIEAWPSIKQFFLDVADYGAAMWQTFKIIWPYLVTFFEWFMLAMEKASEAVGWLISKYETFQKIASYTPLAAVSRAAGTLAGGGGIGDAATSFFDADGSTLIQPSSSSGGNTYNINLNGQYSRSDAVNIATDLETRNYRQY